MKAISEDVEIGKFGGRVSAPPTRFTSSSGQKQMILIQNLTQLKLLHLNYDNAILVIRFDDTDFDYSTALFESISNALEQMPSASFEVVAVSPTGGASFADKARQRASDVFNKIVEMGVPSESVSLASSNSTSLQKLKKSTYT